MCAWAATRNRIYLSAEFLVEKQAKTKQIVYLEFLFLFPLHSFFFFFLLHSFQSSRAFLPLPTSPLQGMKQTNKQKKTPAIALACNIFITINNPVLCIHTRAEHLCCNSLLRSTVFNHFLNRISAVYSGWLAGTFLVLFNTF